MQTKLFAFLVAGALAGCTSPATSMEEQLVKQGCSVNQPDPRACDPTDTKKTTVCHIPPGNPANAHTICVGNAAVPAHLDHGDFVGTCACTMGDDAGVDDAPSSTDDGSIEVL
jgi:hypothetical protein